MSASQIGNVEPRDTLNFFEESDLAELRFLTFFENAPLGFFRVQEKILKDGNRELVRIFGFDSFSEMVKELGELEASPFNTLLGQLKDREDDRDNAFSFHFLRNKEDCWLQVNVKTRRYGDSLWQEGVVKDISEQVLAEQRMKEAVAIARNARKEAEKADKAKSQFLANMSHEIRTPLNGIIGYSEIIESSEDLEESRQHARKILTESDRLMALLNQLLDLSRIEADQIILEKTGFSLEHLIEESIRTLIFKIRRKGLVWHQYIDPAIPPKLLGDPLRVSQIISNLVSNAEKFTKEGQISLIVNLKERKQDRYLLHFSVKDTGSGIPQDKIRHIFESFVQADNSVSRKFGGTGLGIPIARNLLGLMGGELFVDSTPGEGSDFSCELWFSRLYEKETKTVPEPISSFDTGLLKGTRILLVEDYLTNQEIVVHHLKGEGCLVTIADDGFKAVAACKIKKFDLILMDIHMPGMSGLEAAEVIRKSGHETPIIGITASAYSSDKEKCINAGMNDFLPKPIRKDLLLLKMIYWLTPSSRELSVLRFEDFTREMGNDKDAAFLIIKGYVETNKPFMLHNTAHAAWGKDTRELARFFHSLKGGALNIMADKLAEAAARAELVVRERKKKKWDEVRDVLAREWELFLDEWDKLEKDTQ